MSFDPEWSTRRLVARRDEAVRELAVSGVFVPGSVNRTWSKCGKPTCHCAREGDPGHGPRVLWVRYQQGRTVSRTIPARMVGEVDAGVATGQRFTDLVREVSEINAVLTERELRLPGLARPARPVSDGQKRGS